MSKPFKYVNAEWSLAKHDRGFVLTSGSRVLLVTPEGVFECARDGGEVLMDCGNRTLLKVKEHLGDAGAAAQLAADEQARRVQLAKDAVRIAEENVKKAIAEAEKKLAEGKP